MKHSKILSQKLQNHALKSTCNYSRHSLTPYQKTSATSSSKPNLKGTKIRSNTLSLARKVQSSLTKTKNKHADSKIIIKKQMNNNSNPSSKSHSHFNSVNDHRGQNYVKSYKKIETTKPKSHREELKKIIESLKQKEQTKLYKEKLDKKLPSTKTIHIRGRSTQPAINNKSVQMEIEEQLSITYAYRTLQGCLATNPSKPNQDSLLIKSKVCGENNHLFAVADGHGAYGHNVSQFVAKNISKLLQNSLKSLSPSESFKVCFNKLQQSLKESEVNAQCSGTTLISILVKKNLLYCANVGDSRAIIISQNKKKNWQISELSRDHKPDLPDERQRILKSGGRIQSFKDQKGNSLGPLRVWLPKQRLAMSRSIGDNVSKTVGVTCQPEVMSYKIQEKDKFIIMGSDGLWQFINNQEAAKIILPYYKQNKIEQGIGALVKLAHEKWTSQDSSIVDDITVILIFLNK